MKNYLIQATVSDESGEWSTVKQIPTFVLPGEILGIVSKEHAEKIARGMLAADHRVVWATAREMDS